MTQTAKTPDDRPLLRLGHSPDPDDAFMWFPITGVAGAPPAIDTGRFRFEAVQQDIETLNRRSDRGDLEVTAISVAQYPYVADRYAFTSCGSSMGDGYGPRLVAREAIPLEAIREGWATLAIPGRRTSAWLATGLMLGSPERLAAAEVPFDQIIERVASGEFDAGLVIHEGQLTFQDHGLVLLADLGAWWTGRTALPLPLGGNVIRRDLEDRFGPGTLAQVTATLLASLTFALEHRQEAINYALNYARGMDRALADRFVAMYVNKHTLDFGPTGREAVRRFLNEAAQAGLTPPAGPVEFVDPPQR
ncbi:MAG: ABC transporter substrate-binding protein [Phycisphaerales bacterium]|nr:ABC transporter substrate-binding protein [Phycisphaerales bacterium]